MRLVFPDGQEVRYIVPVMRYWEYDDHKIIEHKMYPLLPLQVFKLRYKMESLKRKQENNDNALKEIVLEAKQVTETIAREGKQLYDDREINGDDLHRILLAIANLFEYLNQRYGDNELLEEEVRKMTKSLYDPVVEEKGIEKGIEKGKIETAKVSSEKFLLHKGREEVAKNLLSMGMTVEMVAQATGLSVEKVKELKVF
jgi:predicted transposase/invertase (TIGR01784 family)